MLRIAVENFREAEECPLRNILDKVGDKWSFLIFAVLEDGPKRFNEIKRLVGDISQRVLTRKLRDLERDGYVLRTVHPESPPRVVYELTDLGRSVLEPIKVFLAWAVDTFPDVKRARAAFDQDRKRR